MTENINDIRWEAHEYIQRDKNAGWYVAMVLIAAAIVALAVWRGWWTFAALIVVCVIALILYSVRPPRKLHYVLNKEGLKEENKLYKFEDFKAFGIDKDDKYYAIVLISKKRFSPRVRVYFPQESGEQIIDMFGMRLPMEEVKPDFVDKIVKLLRI
ncbi:hypothetical protein IJI91_00640 [Candidatus Saccharibacteria bacterium]|nr:hypothetical protein [Candidatus Saccharibacteria bacterium]